MSLTNLLIVKQSGINNLLVDWLNDKFWKWGTWLRRVFLGVAVGGAMLIATRTIERAVNGKDGSPGAPPEWQAKQIETLPVETLKGIGSVLEGIGGSEEKEGFFIPVESENNTDWSKIVWKKPEGPYTPNCPIGNPYCKYGYGDGAGWMCWKWAEIYNKEIARLYEEALLLNEDWAIAGRPDGYVSDKDVEEDIVPPEDLERGTTPEPEVLAEMLGQHELTLNEIFNLGEENVVDVNLFQDGTEGRKEELNEAVRDAQSDWFAIMEHFYWREPQMREIEEWERREKHKKRKKRRQQESQF